MHIEPEPLTRNPGYAKTDYQLAMPTQANR